MNRDNDKEMIDAVILRLFEDKTISGWVPAIDIAQMMGYDLGGFKTVVWSLSRLANQGKLYTRIVDYVVPYRRGSGEQRREYRLIEIPACQQAQALRVG
jgi:hypothetical protein